MSFLRRTDHSSGRSLVPLADSSTFQGQSQAQTQVNVSSQNGAAASSQTGDSLDPPEGFFAKIRVVLGFGQKKGPTDALTAFLGVLAKLAIVSASGAIGGAWLLDTERLDFQALDQIQMQIVDKTEASSDRSALEGGACKNWNYKQNAEECPAAIRTEIAFRTSRYWLARGDASMAVGNRDNASSHWREAAAIGRTYGAPTANMASERLSYLELNCPTNRASLDRLSGDIGDAQPVLSSQIRLSDRKRALTALGLYNGPINETPDWGMRNAIFRFQSGLWFSPADGLRPEQTTLLICAAAQRALDKDMQDLLGVMFATGVGVAQNTDSALYWFGKAAEQRDEDAHYHLALMYGLGYVRASNGLCGTTGILERADNYLHMAASLGHKPSKAFIEAFPFDEIGPRDRWNGIENKLGATKLPPLDSCR